MTEVLKFNEHYVEHMEDKVIIHRDDADEKLSISTFYSPIFYAKVHDADTLKFGLNFNKHPIINRFIFYLDGWEDFIFGYQDELTDKEKAEGCERPDDVIGSYAVYYKNMNREGTGKFGHIYRPRFIDAVGNKTWGKIHIEKGIYTVTIDAEFLDTAVYPIIANDTFGYTTVGASTAQDAGGNYPTFCRSITTPQTGNINYLFLYCRVSTGSPQLCPALYSHNAALNIFLDGTPLNNLASSESGTAIGVSLGWVSSVLNSTVQAGTQYWLGFKSGNSSSRLTYAYDNLSDSPTIVSTPVSENWPNTYSNNNYEANQRFVSIYASYDITSSSSFSSSSSSSCKSSSSSCRSSSSSSSCNSSSSSCSSSSCRSSSSSSSSSVKRSSSSSSSRSSSSSSSSSSKSSSSSSSSSTSKSSSSKSKSSSSSSSSSAFTSSSSSRSSSSKSSSSRSSSSSSRSSSSSSSSSSKSSSSSSRSSSSSSSHSSSSSSYSATGWTDIIEN